MDANHFCYIVLCSDGTLYCGYSNDVFKRVKVHNSGKGAKYTKTRLPVKLVYHEKFKTKSEALKRECAIKKFNRLEKLKLIENRHD